MGRDKALLEVDGVPLWRRQRDVLAAAGASEIYLSARPDQLWTRRAEGFTAVLHDAMPGCGPLVGLTAGLERAAQRWLAVLAIDLPAMTAEWFHALAAAAAPGRGVVGRRANGFEPLAALYPRDAMWLAWEALARHEYSLQEFVGAAVEKKLLHVREISDEHFPLFTNWNREEDRRASISWN